MSDTQTDRHPAAPLPFDAPLLAGPDQKKGGAEMIHDLSDDVVPIEDSVPLIRINQYKPITDLPSVVAASLPVSPSVPSPKAKSSPPPAPSIPPAAAGVASQRSVPPELLAPRRPEPLAEAPSVKISLPPPSWPDFDASQRMSVVSELPKLPKSRGPIVFVGACVVVVGLGALVVLAVPSLRARASNRLSGFFGTSPASPMASASPGAALPPLPIASLQPISGVTPTTPVVISLAPKPAGGSLPVPGKVAVAPTIQTIASMGQTAPIAARPASVPSRPARFSPPVRNAPVAANRPSPRPARFVRGPEPSSRPLSVTPRGPAGTLSVQTMPWSQVYVDGRFVHNTPVMRLELSAGIHRVTLVSDLAAVRVTEAVQIRAGQSATLVRRLR